MSDIRITFLLPVFPYDTLYQSLPTIMRTKKIIFTSLLLLAVLNCRAAKIDTKLISDSLYTCLSKAATPTDSLRIMENLFDVLPRNESTKLGLKIFDVANHAGDSSAALDILRQLANRYMRSDSMLMELYNKTFYFHDGPTPTEDSPYPAKTDELKETRTFLRFARNIHRANHASEAKRMELLPELVHTYTLNPPTDLYDQIALLHSICTLLSRTSSDALLSRYIDKLGTLIQQLPPSAISLYNAYYVHAALIYSTTDQFEKSYQADLKTLDAIKRLEKQYLERGRIYRNYDTSRYIIYKRILSNYQKLSAPEVDKYYRLAMQLVDNNPDVSLSFKSFPGPQIYYNMAHKNYPEALALIKNCINSPDVADSSYRLMSLLKNEIECAEAVGDKETLLEASRLYNKKLEAYLSERLDEKYRELQVIYDTYEIRNDYNKLQIEKQNSEAQSMKTIALTGIIAIIILLVSTIILLRLYRKNRKLVRTLDKSNRALRAESTHLEKSKNDLLKARDEAQKANYLKTDFIKNMSYEVNAPLKAINEYCKLITDCSDASNKKYLERFSSLVELNSELLSTIINDVLHISEIDSESVPVHNRPVELRPLCTMVLDGVRHRLKPGVDLMFDASSPEISLFTDPQRVHQILLNLLTNAAKFTSKGSITLGYSVDNENDSVIFSVTDTGIGIKADKKDLIFERFVKLDKETQGAGLGLTISRLLARILGGDVMLDTTYTKGARFLLILPKK